MIKSFLVFLFLLSSLSVYANGYVEGRASYKMQPKESLRFAKSYLHYLAYRDVLTKELNKLGLNAKDFWAKYDTSFNQSFQEHQERYDKAIAGAKTTDARQNTLASMKEYKLRKQKSFAGLSHVITSDAIRNFGTKLGDSQTRTLSLDAKVNYKALRKVYSRFMIDSLKTKSFQEVVIRPNFDWGSLSFELIGAQTKSELENKIIRGWKEWFSQNTNPNQPIKAFTADEARSISAEGSRASLFIGIRARADEVKGDGLTVHYQFSLALRDDENQDFIFFKDLSDMQKYYKVTVDESRTMTNDVWSTPIPHFITLRSMLERSILTENSISVFVRNYKNINDVLKIQDKLKTIGIGINLLSDLEYFQSSTARLSLRYNGDIDNLRKVLKSVQNDFFPVELILEGDDEKTVEKVEAKIGIEASTNSIQ